MGIRIDEETLEVRAIELTGSNIGNAPMLPDLLGQVAQVKRLAAAIAQTQTRYATIFWFFDPS